MIYRPSSTDLRMSAVGGDRWVPGV